MIRVSCTSPPVSDSSAESDHQSEIPFSHPGKVRKLPRGVRTFPDAGRKPPSDVGNSRNAGSQFPRGGREFTDGVRKFPGAVSHFPSGVRSRPSPVRKFPGPVNHRPAAVRGFPVRVHGFPIPVSRCRFCNLLIFFHLQIISGNVTCLSQDFISPAKGNPDRSPC